MSEKDQNILLVLGGITLIGLVGTTHVISKMLYPLYSKITSPFGYRINPVTGQKQFHNGIDLSAAVATKIKSPGDGIVSNYYSNDVGGNQLIIKHDNGFTTGYAHLNKSFVSMGERVNQGQFIAESGNTGKVTGPHLHLTLRDKDGNLLDPEKFFS